MPEIFWAAFGGGLGGGLAVAFVEVYRWYVDRPLVKCKVNWGIRKSAGTGDQHPKYIFFEAINPHTKTVTLSAFGLLYKEKDWGKIDVNPEAGYNFPYDLEGGKSLSQGLAMEYLLEVLRQSDRAPKDLKWGYFEAESGKTYRGKIPKWVIEKLEKEFDKPTEAD
jgi:hypothetical protein